MNAQKCDIQLKFIIKYKHEKNLLFAYKFLMFHIYFLINFKKEKTNEK